MLFRSHIRFERVVTPADWESKVDVYRGATFNLAHSFSQMLHLRPQNRFEEFDRMYLVGGGTHPGSGLPVIFESARISSKLVLDDLGLAALAPARAQLPTGRQRRTRPNQRASRSAKNRVGSKPVPVQLSAPS